MPEFIRKLLETNEGRDLLSDALLQIAGSYDPTPVIQNIDIRLITYNAQHRVVNHDIDTDKLVDLIEVKLHGFSLYRVHDGNHRIEMESKKSNTIKAKVTKSTLKALFISTDGTLFTRNENDAPWKVKIIPEKLQKVLIELNLNPIPDKRTYIG